MNGFHSFFANLGQNFYLHNISAKFEYQQICHWHSFIMTFCKKSNKIDNIHLLIWRVLIQSSLDTGSFDGRILLQFLVFCFLAGTEFDLTPLKITDGSSWSVTDKKGHKYQFNVCGVVKSSDCKDAGDNIGMTNNLHCNLVRYLCWVFLIRLENISCVNGYLPLNIE